MERSVSTDSLKMPKDNEHTNFNKNGICLTTAYLAPVDYYAAMLKANSVWLEYNDTYVKQTYRNRCQIATANGLMVLSIPIEKSDREKQLTRDVRISAHNLWQLQHWRTIESAYNSSPFFEYYADDLISFYEKKWNFLWDFNFEIQQKILELIDLQINIKFTDKFQKSFEDTITDLRDYFHPKKINRSIDIEPYYQVFDQRLGFQPNISIIDLLFNMGNETLLKIDSFSSIIS